MNQLLSLLDSTFVERIGWALVHSLWQIAIVAVAVAAANLVLARKRADVRYLVFCAGMLACVAFPIATLAALELTAQSTASVEGISANDDSTGQDAVGNVIAMPSPSSTDSTLIAVSGPTDNASPATVALPLPGDEKLVARFETGDSGVMAAIQMDHASDDSPIFRRRFLELDSWLPTIFSVWISGVIVLAFRPLIGIFFSRRMRHYGRSSVPQNVSRLMAEACRQLRLHDEWSVVHRPCSPSSHRV